MLNRIRNDILKVSYASFYKLILSFSFACMLIACGGSSGSSSENGLFSVAGKVTVQRDSDVDLDLNASISLNDEDNPQFISNPTTIGGYLSGYAGAYSLSERVFSSDLQDYYSVPLVEGQEIELSLFQADASLETIDLELRLIDENDLEQANIVIDEFSANTLTVPSDGLYTLAMSVSEQTSPILYTLSLSQALSKQSLSDIDMQALSYEFVPEEVLLKLKPNASMQSLNKLIFNSSSSLLTPSGVQTKFLPEALTLKDNLSVIGNLYQINSFLDQTVQSPSVKQSFPTAYIEPEAKESHDLLEKKKQTLALIKKMNASGLVEFAEPNYIYHSTATTNDPRLSDQWNLSMLSAQAAWEVSSGQGVVVAVLDTGIDENHEDLSNNISSESYDFISDSKSSGDGDGFDANPNDEGTSFHGSHVSGIIAAESNTKGIAGLAYDSKIMALRVLGVQDTGTSSDIAQAILYAAGLTDVSGNPSNQMQRADIINMSFGSEARSETIKAAIDLAFNKGLILIAAAGNMATDRAFYPAAFENVIGVGAVSDDKTRASFSNYGVNVDLVAPGGTGSGSASFDGFQDAILSTVEANNYAEYSGTSMSAPHVSAVAALIKNLKPDLNGYSFKAAIEEGALTQNLSAETQDINNFYGKGLIDAAKSVVWAEGSNTIPGILNVYPSNFGFIGANTKADLTLSNPGNGAVNVLSIQEQENWLQVTAKDDVSNTSSLGTYLVEINSALTFLDQGIITINYQVDNEPVQQTTINVFVSRSTQSDPNVGNVFVALYKEEDILNNVYEIAYGLDGDLVDGAYEYSISNVAQGRYLLTASTDHDGDNIPFDEGEAIGTFPLLSRPAFIEVSDKSLNNIDFDIQYPVFSSTNTVNLQKVMKATPN